jgi:hypothetical protein
MDAGVALLHAAVVAPAEQLSSALEQGGSNRDATFIETNPGFFEGHRQHAFV